MSDDGPIDYTKCNSGYKFDQCEDSYEGYRVLVACYGSIVFALSIIAYIFDRRYSKDLNYVLLIRLYIFLFSLARMIHSIGGIAGATNLIFLSFFYSLGTSIILIAFLFLGVMFLDVYFKVQQRGRARKKVVGLMPLYIIISFFVIAITVSCETVEKCECIEDQETAGDIGLIADVVNGLMVLTIAVTLSIALQKLMSLSKRRSERLRFLIAIVAPSVVIAILLIILIVLASILGNQAGLLIPIRILEFFASLILLSSCTHPKSRRQLFPFLFRDSQRQLSDSNSISSSAGGTTSQGTRSSGSSLHESQGDVVQ